MKKTPAATKATTSARHKRILTARLLDNVNDRACRLIELTTTGKAESRVDSRLLSQQLDIKHPNLFAMLKTHKTDFEEFGKVVFQTRPLPSGQREKIALLNEDQAFLLLTYSRNTAKVRALKIRLVRAFAQARRAAELRQTEYLPAYHAMRESIHAVSAGASCEGHIHSNCARLINKVAGIGPGQRASAPPAVQSILTVAQLLMAQAFSEATDHRDGYRRAKLALQAIEGINAPLALAQQAQAASKSVAIEGGAA